MITSMGKRRDDAVAMLKSPSNWVSSFTVAIIGSILASGHHTVMRILVAVLVFCVAQFAIGFLTYYSDKRRSGSAPPTGDQPPGE